MLRVGFQASAYTVEEEDGYLEVCVELTAWKDDLSLVSIIPVHTGSAEGIVSRSKHTASWPYCVLVSVSLN